MKDYRDISRQLGQGWEVRLVAWSAGTVVAIVILGAMRLLQVIHQTHVAEGKLAAARFRLHRSPSDTCRTVVFLGSGGHTGEMLRLLCGMDLARYSPRTYLISSGDSLSLAKVSELERSREDFPGRGLQGVSTITFPQT